MPVIIFLRVFALGEQVDVFAVPELPENYIEYADLRDERVSLAFLMPSLCADVSVKAFFSGGVPRVNYAAVSLAAVGFLRYARGLPLEEVSVETPSGIFEVMCINGREEIGILLRKCKLLRTKSFVYASSIELLAVEIATKCGVVRIFECADADSFSSEALSVLSLGAEGENICAAVALSFRGGCAKLKLNRVNSDKESPLLDAILASGTLIYEKWKIGTTVDIELLGARYSIRECEGGLLVSSPMSFMRFDAPYL